MFGYAVMCYHINYIKWGGQGAGTRENWGREAGEERAGSRISREAGDPLVKGHVEKMAGK